MTNGRCEPANAVPNAMYHLAVVFATGAVPGKIMIKGCMNNGIALRRAFF